MKIKLILSIAIISGYSLCSAMDKEKTEETPEQILFRAVRAGDLGLKLAEKAIALGANVNAKDVDNNTALMCLIKRSPTYETEKIVQLLLESGADINIKNYDKLGYCITALNNAKEALTKIQIDIKRRKIIYKPDLDALGKLKTSIINVINLLENWPAILKEREEKIKQEVNAYLLPELGNIVAQYTLPIK